MLGDILGAAHTLEANCRQRREIKLRADRYRKQEEFKWTIPAGRFVVDVSCSQPVSQSVR